MRSIGTGDHEDVKRTTKIKKTEGGGKRIKIRAKATTKALFLSSNFVGQSYSLFVFVFFFIFLLRLFYSIRSANFCVGKCVGGNLCLLLQNAGLWKDACICINDETHSSMRKIVFPSYVCCFVFLEFLKMRISNFYIQLDLFPHLPTHLPAL